LHDQAHEQAGAGQSPQQQAQPRRALVRPVLALESKSRDTGRGAQARCYPSTSAAEPAGKTPRMAPPKPDVPLPCDFGRGLRCRAWVAKIWFR
jgi:hypothetical protein